MLSNLSTNRISEAIVVYLSYQEIWNPTVFSVPVLPCLPLFIFWDARYNESAENLPEQIPTSDQVDSFALGSQCVNRKRVKCVEDLFLFFL